MSAGFREVVYDPADPVVAGLVNYGAAAVTAVGQYVVIAPNDTAVTNTAEPLWDAAGAGTGTISKAVAWVRGGAYARTFSLTVKTAAATVTAAYTTPAAAYSGVLDTSAVPVFALDSAGGTQTDHEAVYAQNVGDALGPRHALNWGHWAPTGLTAKRGTVAMTNTHPALPTTAFEFYWAPGAQYLYLKDETLSTDSDTVTATYSHAKVVANPNYTSIVGDLTNEYNSAVTAWIASAAQAIKAEAIAEQLFNQLAASGVAVTRFGSHLSFEGCQSLSFTDGGDGTLVRAVAHEVTAVDELSQQHWVGKTVRVRPSTGGDAFYMKAAAKASGATGFVEVVWVEGGAVKNTLSGGLVFGLTYGDKFYLASTSAYMQGLCGQDVPAYEPGEVGDNDTNAPPYFVGRQITYLGVFQDRLLIGCGGVVRASRVGEYLTFYRRSILTTLADDAIELTSPGDEQDTIRYSVLYERNLVLLGDQQYVVSGTVPLTPTNAVMQIMSAHKYAGTAQPAVAGSSIFYLKNGSAGTVVSQLQPGQYAETTEAYPLTSALSSYIPIGGVDILPIGEPNLLVVRSLGASYSLYLFRYVDTPQGREQAAWFRFEYAQALGSIVGVSTYQDGVLLFKSTPDAVHAEYQPFTTTPSLLPYLDAQSSNPDLGRGAVYAFGFTGDYPGIGGTQAYAEQFGFSYVRGTPFVSTVELTPPYVLNQQGKALLGAELVVTRYSVQLAQSCGALVAVGTDAADYVPPDAVGDEILQGVRITDQRIPVPAFVDNADARLTITSKDWLPCTITSVGWVGQMYNRTQGIP